MGKDEGELELYKIAIEGYQKHWEHYNHWMNMYAIFNGALFVGLYTFITQNTSEDCGNAFLFKFLICILGCISSLFWLFSARGFYRWLKSWVEVVKKQELAFCPLLKEDIDEKYLYIYRAFIQNNKDFNNFLSKRPFSTQKLTQWFVGCVTVIWHLILFYVVFQRCNIISNFLEQNIWICLIVIGAAYVFIAFFCGLKMGREDVLSKSHTLMKCSGVDKYTIYEEKTDCKKKEEK